MYYIYTFTHRMAYSECALPVSFLTCLLRSAYARLFTSYSCFNHFSSQESQSVIDEDYLGTYAATPKRRRDSVPIFRSINSNNFTCFLISRRFRLRINLFYLLFSLKRHSWMISRLTKRDRWWWLFYAEYSEYKSIQMRRNLYLFRTILTINIPKLCHKMKWT